MDSSRPCAGYGNFRYPLRLIRWHVAFFALVAALLIEQLRPLPKANPIYRLMRRYLRSLERGLDAGRYEQGIIAWVAATAPPVIVIAGVSIYLTQAAPPLALMWNALVLYATMGMRQFTREFNAILEALRTGDLDAARAAMARWRGAGGVELSPGEIARLAIERGLIEAHRHVFGVIAYFVVFGAAGALGYRIAAMLYDVWGARTEGAFGHFSRKAFEWIDWIPVRLSAISFAVVGDFEDAIYCWRTQAHAWQDVNQGVLLASGAGALGVRLGSVVSAAGLVEFRPDLGTGDEADVDLMTSSIGLIWRALVLWLFLILLLTVANWLG